MEGHYLANKAQYDVNHNQMSTREFAIIIMKYLLGHGKQIHPSSVEQGK